jgi:hypothetical protein
VNALCVSKLALRALPFPKLAPRVCRAWTLTERPACFEIDPRKACGQARLRMSVTRGSSPRATLRNDLLFTMSKNSPARDLSIGPARRFHMDGSRRFRRTQRGDPAGGARRDRTDDLLLAKQALSQLSYGPILARCAGSQTLKNWWAWEDLNFRPHAYQARALTN